MFYLLMFSSSFYYLEKIIVFDLGREEKKALFWGEEDNIEFAGWKIKRERETFFSFSVVSTLKMFLRCIFRLQLFIFK